MASSTINRVPITITIDAVSPLRFFIPAALPMNYRMYLQQLVILRSIKPLNTVRINLRGSQRIKFQRGQMTCVSSCKLIQTSIVMFFSSSVLMYQSVQSSRVEIRLWLYARLFIMYVMLKVSFWLCLLRKGNLNAIILVGMLEISFSQMGVFQYCRQMTARGYPSKRLTLQLLSRYSMTFWHS